MTIKNISVTLKFTKKWFYAPVYFLSVLYVFLGGSHEKASDYVAKKCFSVKVIRP